MKTAILSLILVLGSAAHASTYECNLSNGQPNDPAAVTYSLDTQTEENKFVELQDGSSVGCIVFRSQPELLTCGIGNDGKFSMFVTAESNTAVLALDSSNTAGKANLKCVRRN